MRSSTSNGPSSARQPWRASLLRHVNHYGPGTGFDLDGDLVKLVRKRRFPIVGNGAGVWSFIHVDDLAQATFGWQPHYKSWRDGFRTGLGEITPPGSDRTHLQRRPRRLTGARRVRKLVRGSLERSSR